MAHNTKTAQDLTGTHLYSGGRLEIEAPRYGTGYLLVLRSGGDIYHTDLTARRLAGLHANWDRWREHYGAGPFAKYAADQLDGWTKA